MKVLIPSPLRSYSQCTWVQAQGATLGDVLSDLDAQFPGIRFRMVDEQDRLRPHVRFFVRSEAIFDLATPLTEKDELLIVQALSGG